jgi:hypothetical protein
MYFTDRGIEELEDRRGDEEVTMAWLAERLRDFVDLNPDFETPIDRLASWLARLDSEEDLLFRTSRGACARPPSLDAVYHPHIRDRTVLLGRIRAVTKLGEPGQAGAAPAEPAKGSPVWCGRVRLPGLGCRRVSRGAGRRPRTGW